jgi:hypothetical protein
MPNWCYNEFHIEVEGSAEDAIAIAQKLHADDGDAGKRRSSLRENDFPFELTNIITPPDGFLSAQLNEEAKFWLSKTHTRTSSGNPIQDLKRAHFTNSVDTSKTPLPCDIIEAEKAAANTHIFGNATRYEWQDEAIGTARAQDGTATIEQLSEDRCRITATTDSAWSPLDKAGSALLQLSEKITEIKTFWIEEGNDFYGACLVNRDGASIGIDENNCGDALRQADRAINPSNYEDEEEPVKSNDEDEVDDYEELPNDISYNVLFEWLSKQLEEKLKAAQPSKSPSP